MRSTLLVGLLAFGMVFAGMSVASASTGDRVIRVKTVRVTDPGNASVAVVPFADAIYETCADAPVGPQGCVMVGGVDQRYAIGQLEVTVEQWVTFLNVVDPSGKDPHRLYDPVQAPAAWPKFGQINFTPDAAGGKHYSVGYPAWSDKPYGFANFLRSARFVNSMYNGQILSERVRAAGGFDYIIFRVRLSRVTEEGMYDLSRRKATRAHASGFVVPSQDEWIKAAYYDPDGGGTYSYWKYPTNEGVFGDDTATAPSMTTLDPTTGDVTNAATQPLATYHDPGLPAPTWCPASPDDCANINPFGIDPTTYAELYQGSLSTVGQAETVSPWGTLDQGGNVVEWTDTITAAPAGTEGPRVWRRLHGGIANAPAYQLWLSAVGLQPQDNAFYTETYPWLGFRIGVTGRLAAKAP